MAGVEVDLPLLQAWKVGLAFFFFAIFDVYGSKIVCLDEDDSSAVLADDERCSVFFFLDVSTTRIAILLTNCTIFLFQGRHCSNSYRNEFRFRVSKFHHGGTTTA
ncbi:unnamed protein product [Amoebophrya sp. A120]|nr:unnamed protein product [Amoebophrya sp. A120]|eukprot:GSA120T00024655001.1